MVAKIEPLLTIADLDAMPEDGNRYELIEGELFASRAPTLTPQEVVLLLTIALQKYLERHPTGKIWPAPGVIFSDFSEVIPDIIYVSNERIKEIASGDRVVGAPDLIIEVLSPGAENERRDRKAKRKLYQKYGVKEHWLIDPQLRTVEMYRTRSSSSQQSSVAKRKSLLLCFRASTVWCAKSLDKQLT
ncbi:MAG TPA: Uma2 family endonuclease [Blastocatellia bacterium]|nr:Uma2 family endonuclease [Blastocatellia bacterium]